MRLLKYYFDCHVEDGEAVIIGYSASLKLVINSKDNIKNIGD